MKLLAWALVDSPRAIARFRREAETTAALDHPGIVAVHDQGTLSDGRPWFTMREVRGRTLAAILADAPASASSLRDHIRILQAISQAVAYAHGRSVIHRDLKPVNVMVGAFGEVVVMDWGLARSVEARDDDALGTPAYMAPEQARGERVDQRADVYALGAILHEILTGRPPHDGGARTALRAARARVLGSVVRVAPELEHVAADLRALCEHALAPDPTDRPADAAVVVERVRAWLERDRRQHEAEARVAEADALQPRLEELRATTGALRAEAARELGEIRSYEPVSKKRAAWAKQDEAEKLELEIALLEVKWFETLRAALHVDPESASAHARLAAHHARELARAERQGDDPRAARHETLLREHDRGAIPHIVSGRGELTLITDPPCRAILYQYVEIDRRLVAQRVDDLGATPVVRRALPRGSYVIELVAPECGPVRYPVLIERGEHWIDRRPGDHDTSPVIIPHKDDLDANDAFIPGGFFWSGGDPSAIEALPSRRLWLDARVIRRFPVTNREYLAFLNSLVDRGREDDALRFAPRVPPGTGVRGGGPPGDAPLAYARKSDGAFALEQFSHATPWDIDGPVVLVDWHGARAFAAWEAARTGEPWRLIEELEWEKAARGGDGRAIVWGRHIEPTRANVAGSHPDLPRPVDVHAYPEDESPYGVRGVVGNVRQWCGNTWKWDGPAVENAIVLADPAAEADTELRSIRGGAWFGAPETCRVAARFALSPSERMSAVGIRLARDFVGRSLRQR
jgi:formylglycine-generating enzyme required for sulfatase activity